MGDLKTSNQNFHFSFLLEECLASFLLPLLTNVGIVFIGGTVGASVQFIVTLPLF